MKYFGPLFYLMLYLSPVSSQSLEDVARAKEITWYGIDFSETRFVNFDNELSVNSLTDSLISRWSLYPLSPEKNAAICKMYLKNSLKLNDRSSHMRNISIDYSNRLVNSNYNLDDEAVRNIISKYDVNGTGYGLLLVVEEFEKNSNRAYIWVVFIDNTSKKLLAIRRYICDSKNGDIENRWLSAIDLALRYGGKILRAIR